eukprot:scaffold66750_cov33-Tisochrysis_lutea.AAC.1
MAKSYGGCLVERISHRTEFQTVGAEDLYQPLLAATAARWSASSGAGASVGLGFLSGGDVGLLSALCYVLPSWGDVLCVVPGEARAVPRVYLSRRVGVASIGGRGGCAASVMIWSPAVA